MSRPDVTRCLARGEYYGRVVTHREVAGLRLTELHYARSVLLPEHRHECAYLWLMITGSSRQYIGSKERLHRPFTFGYCPVGLEHRDEIGRLGARLFAIELDAQGADMIRDLNGPMSAMAAEIHDTLAFGAVLQMHSEFLRARDDRYEMESLTAETRIAEIIGTVFEPRARPIHRHPRWLGPIMEYLDAHYASPVRIGALAARAGVHPIHLARVFRQVHRCSIARYLTTLRVRRACALLGVGDFTLSQIALQTGFADQSHFTRAFTSMIGAPPGVFRRSVFPQVRVITERVFASSSTET